MSLSIRAGILLALMGFVSAGIAPAATPKEIDAAIKKGADYLKARYAKGNPSPDIPGSGGATHGIGPTCLAGLALLEAGVPVTDPALKTITEMVRDASFSQTKTYRVALCLMYLDRLGDTNDEHLIQMLAARLVVGQSSNGGWGYDTISSVPPADEQRLRAIRPNQQAGKLHPEIEKYGNGLAAAKVPGATVGDDNSNTQFGVLATWMARKHGVPVEAALDRIEQRFLNSQNSRTGGWNYSGTIAGEGIGGSPSMYCAGLIGLATGVARREERRAKADHPKKDDKPKTDSKTKSDDPFFNPPAKASTTEPKKGSPARAPDARDRAVQFAFAGLGAILAESAKAGNGGLYLGAKGLGHHDLYFFWSLERAGVVFGMEKIGGVDWYEAGAHTLVYVQSRDGSWGVGGVANGVGYGGDVNTAFAVLFLCRSNLARDLSSKVQKEVSTEMRAGAGPTGAKSSEPGGTGNPNPAAPDPILTGPTGSEAAVLAGELIRANEKDWEKALKKLRDTKGPVYTQALVASVSRLDGERRKAAREALAERLTRMTAATLRTMAKDEDPELRRASVLAMAMKDDKSHLPDLVAALLDEEEVVVRAAKAGLKSVTGQDFGPAINATAGEKKLAVASWNDWLAKQKK